MIIAGEMLRTKIHRAETRVLDKAAGKVQAIVSDESEDRDGDVIRVAGWQLDSFLRHPILLSSHNYYDLRSQIGEWESMQVKGKRLVGVANYYIGKGNEEADWAFQLAEMGRAAYSVGFIPHEYEKREGGSDWGGPFEFTAQELLEVSHVSVPSNANALQLMAKAVGVHPEVDAIVQELLAERQEKAGRTMSQGNLDSLHDAMGSLAKVHDAVCDMGEDCPMMGKSWRAPASDLGHLLRALLAAKGPIASHSTATSDSAWDGPGARASLRNDETAAYYRRAFAWVDDDADVDTKAAYKFIHHEVSDGEIAAANFIACSAGIAVLNGGRGGADIPDSDRQGVWNHLARHLRDGDREPPELRGIEEEDLTGFRALLMSLG